MTQEAEVKWGDPPVFKVGPLIILGPGPVSDKWRAECREYGYVICPTCDGKGRFPGDKTKWPYTITCVICGGAGTFSRL